MSFRVREATLFEATRVHGQTTEFLGASRGWDLEYDGIVLWVRANGEAVLIPNANIKSLTLAEGQLPELPQPGPTLADARKAEPEPASISVAEPEPEQPAPEPPAPEQRKRGR